jgi:acetyl esterase/lipase
VGDCDLFHDEDAEYARRLTAAGVPVELETVAGAFHGFDVFGGAPVAKAFFASQVTALQRALA